MLLELVPKLQRFLEPQLLAPQLLELCVGLGHHFRRRIGHEFFVRKPLLEHDDVFFDLLQLTLDAFALLGRLHETAQPVQHFHVARNRHQCAPRPFAARLGNPGREYRETRHNVGFMVVEEIARRYALTWSQAPSQVPDAFIAKRYGTDPLMLAKPLTDRVRRGFTG